MSFDRRKFDLPLRFPYSDARNRSLTPDGPVQDQGTAKFILGAARRRRTAAGFLSLCLAGRLRKLHASPLSDTTRLQGIRRL